jgi:hypothetical protein
MEEVCSQDLNQYIGNVLHSFWEAAMKRAFFEQAAVIAMVVFVAAGCTDVADTVVSDSKSSHRSVLDRGLWVTGGGIRGWREDAPLGDGNWNFSHDQIMDTTDGYLRIRVWGPRSANTYGAEAWVRTVQDFNDGRSHTINFTWEARPTIAGHFDYYFIQITDGFIPAQGDLHWPMRRPPLKPIQEVDLKGTADLIVTQISGSDSVSPGQSLPNGFGPATMSIKLEPSGVARLYDSPNASGRVLHETTLDPDSPWYVRFMVCDGTSAGFSAGDSSLHLYDFSVSR